MVVLLEGSPISIEELWSSVRVTIEFLVISLTNALDTILSQHSTDNSFDLMAWFLL
jgi:hypothetical protein